jgi:hypothetical protein
MISSYKRESAKQSHPVLLGSGILAIFLTALLAGRIVWEETILTIDHGPQMIGFSLAHGSGALLLFAPLMLVIWLIVAFLTIAISLWRKRSLPKPLWTSLAIAIAVLGLLALPPVFWQWLFIGSFAKSAHSIDLMTYAAAEGHVRTVRGYLSHGVALEGTNYEGSTAAFTGAAGGSVPVIEMLASMGANLNAINSYGDSPLEAAIENHHDAAVTYLRAHGATQIRGTPEQREAASQSIVRKQIERTH